MKTRIFNLIIIDESGSMQSIKKQTIDGINETIQTTRSAQEKHEGQEHFVSLVTFNDGVKTIYDCVPVGEVKEFTSETYNPARLTALYDAIGISLNALRKKVAENEVVLVTIITDGYENASEEYIRRDIKVLIDELKAKGWVFAYIGANHDVKQAASTISISNTLSFEATDEGMEDMIAKLDCSKSTLYGRLIPGIRHFNAGRANEKFFDDTDDEY